MFENKTELMSAKEVQALFKKGSKARGIKPMPRAKLEYEFQKSAVIYLRNVLPASAVLFHIPNGEERNVKIGAKLKAMGLKPGMPDLGILYNGNIYFIELKVGKEPLNAAQQVTIPEIRAAGSLVFVCNSLERIESALENYIPLLFRMTPYVKTVNP